MCIHSYFQVDLMLFHVNLWSPYYYFYIFILFQRMDIGECPKIHDNALRADFEKAQQKFDHFYDVDVSCEKISHSYFIVHTNILTNNLISFVIGY